VIKILRVPLVNKPGQLYGAVTTISGAGVDMKALSLTNTSPDEGEVLLLVNDLAKARRALEKAGLPSTAESAVVLEVPDEAGGLASVLKATAKAGLSINDMFTFVTRLEGKALAVATFDDNGTAESLLLKAGVQTVGQDAITEELDGFNEPHALEDYLGGSFFW